MLTTLVFLIAITGCVSRSAIRYETDDAGGIEFTLNLSHSDESEKSWLSSPSLPGLQFRGSLITEDDGVRRFDISETRLFSNWPDGWSEAHFSTTGSARIDDSGLLSFTEAPELFEIVEGSIRHQDNRIRGDEGLNLMQRRYDRIASAVTAIKKLPQMPPLILDGKQMARLIEQHSFFMQLPAGLAEVQDSLRNDWREAPRMWVTLYNMTAL